MRAVIFLALCLVLVKSAFAHDTWVQTNTNVIRTGDAVHVDLLLGNHGNNHRDYKLASKTTLDGCTLKVHDPANRSYDLLEQLADTGYTPKEGFWTAKFAATSPGLYLVEHRFDKVVNHGKPVRSIKSGKAFFVVSRSLDRVPRENAGFDRVLGHALELVPTANPVTPMGPGQPMAVRVLLKGKPLPQATVSFIPRGEALTEGFDDRFERKTDADGQASFTPSAGNYYLVVVHHRADDETGVGYEGTQYSATLNVLVPDLCPCCGE